MKTKKSKGRYDAVAIHDGTEWRLVRVASGGAAEVAAFASAANRLPPEFVDKAVQEGVGSVRFLVSGEMHRIEGAIPSGASLAKANEQIRLAISETSGVDAEGSVVAGMTFRWPGVRKPFTLAGSVDAGFAEDVHAALAEAGIVCAGFASLEIAILAVWREKMSARASFASVCSGQALVVPASRGANGGPQTAACGLRHFASDPDNWLTRFSRTVGAVGRDDPLHLLVWGDDAAVASKLSEAGYSQIVVEKASDWLADIAKIALRSRSNRLANTPVPVANPYEPRKKFSHGWLVAAAVLVLLLPVGYRVLCEMSTESRCAALGREMARLKPAADKVIAAQRVLAAAKAELSAEKASESSRIAMRRPLMAFIDVAYFFCKYAGGSTVLRSLVQKDDRITVEGVFADPEDGVRLNKAVLAYAKEKGIEIVENVADAEMDEESSAANRFRLVFNCAKVGEIVK